MLGASEIIAEARWLEDLAFEYIAAGEHLMRGEPAGVRHASLPLLAVAACATEYIRLFT